MIDVLVPTLRVGTQSSDALRQFLDAERRKKLGSRAEAWEPEMCDQPDAPASEPLG